MLHKDMYRPYLTSIEPRINDPRYSVLAGERDQIGNYYYGKLAQIQQESQKLFNDWNAIKQGK